MHSAGRTDAGVHALGQCAHADVITRLEPAKLLTALNAALLVANPNPAKADSLPRTTPAFPHTGKVYRYRIVTTPVFSPFEINRAWHLQGPLDERLLQECAKTFQGQHDFAAFAANRGTPVDSSVRTLREE